MQQEGRSHRPDKKDPEALRVEKSDLGFSSCSFKYAYISCLQLWKNMKKYIIQVLTLKGILKVISAMYLQLFLMLNIVSEVEVLTCNPFSTFFYRSPCICCSMWSFTTLWRGRETRGVCIFILSFGFLLAKAALSDISCLFFRKA